MDSKRTVNLYITGFGPFDTITNNPTEEIVNDIDLTSLCEFEGCTVNVEFKEVLDVDLDSVKTAIGSIHDLIQEHMYDDSANCHYWISTEIQLNNIHKFGSPPWNWQFIWKDLTRKTSKKLSRLLYCR